MAAVRSGSGTRERFIGSEAFDASQVVFNPGADREPRVDGATSGEFGAYRERTSHTPPFPYSDVILVTAAFCLAFVHEEGSRIELAIDEQKRAGAPRKSRGFEAVAHEIATSVIGSSRRTDRLLRDRTVWKEICAATRQAWPDQPDRWASPTPIDRRRRDHMLNRVYDTLEKANELKLRCRDWIGSVAESVGMADPDSGTLTTPAPEQVLIGDLTWTHSRFNRTADERYDVDVETGEILRTRLHDPDTSRSHYYAKKSGQAIVSTKLRNPHPHEWLVLDFEFVAPGKRNEGELFRSMTFDLIKRLPGVRAITYDMALSDQVINDLMRAGLHTLVKVARIRGGRPAAVHLGAHPFTHPRGGSKARSLSVDAVDGCPVITVPSDDKNLAIPLRRIRNTQARRADGTYRTYGVWEIPDLPEVPGSWVGLRARIRHDSNPDEPVLRTRALRTIPENDPDWRPLFGLRNSVESMHAHFKSLLPGRRFRNVGQRRRTVNQCGYTLSRAVSTLLAHHHRTGASLEQWFGKWTPPDPKWWLSEGTT